MKVDLRTPPSQPVAEVVRFAQKCEEAGFWGCGFNDAQMYFRDTYVVMSQVLQNTERLRVHPALTCPGPRHTSLVASSAKTVQEFGPDRFELWLGRGNAALRMVGIPQLRVSEMRDSILKIRAFMAGEWRVYEPTQGISDSVRMHHGGGEPVPVYLAARGPKVTRLAGELCDGVLMTCPPTAEGISRSRRWLAEGAARAGRDVSAVHEVLELHCLVRDTRKQAVRAWSPNLVPILGRPDSEDWLRQRGIDYDIAPLKPKIQDAYARLDEMYPNAGHIEDWEAGEKLAEVIPYELQEAMGDSMAVLGDPDQVARRFIELEVMGVGHIYMYPVETFRFPEPERRAFQEVIGPALSLTGD